MCGLEFELLELLELLALDELASRFPAAFAAVSYLCHCRSVLTQTWASRWTDRTACKRSELVPLVFNCM